MVATYPNYISYEKRTDLFLISIDAFDVQLHDINIYMQQLEEKTKNARVL
jgi:hypothetical protein